jgi:hypothetical protein
MTQAYRASFEVPGRTLSERVERCLHRSTCTVESLREVRQDVAALCGEAMALEFWALCSRYLSGDAVDDRQKAMFVQAVSAHEPKQALSTVAPRAEEVAVPYSGGLSSYLEEVYGVRREMPRS